MMPRKTRNMIVIISVLVVLLIITLIFILLYMNTDMLKSSSTLFAKYIGQNMENMGAVYERFGTDEFDELLKQNKYTTDTEAKINFTENMGTSSETTQNSISQLKLKIKGQTDKTNEYNYQDIHLLSNAEKVSEVEYIQSGKTYGIRFSDLFNQYILADNENLKELFRKMGYTEEELVNIPDSIEFDTDLKTIFQFSKEEEQNLKTKYISIINSNISKENFSKQQQLIQIDGKDIEANSYILIMTKEQLNNIYIKILEEVKQDEVILAKIDKLQTILGKYQSTETTALREKFTARIDNLITDITRNNIGQDETKIIVYENNQTTIRTTIQHPDYQINIDVLQSETNNYMQISYQDIASEEEQVLTYKKGKEETSIIFDNTEDGKTIQYSIIINNKVDGNNCVKDIVAKYEGESDRVETIIKQKINIVENFENEVVLNEENSINLSKLEAEQVQLVLNKAIRAVSEKISEITTNTIKIEEVSKVINIIGNVKEQQVLEATGITETEKNRFNSQFEILQGDKLKSKDILELIDAVQDNLIDMEVVSNKELKLKLDRFEKNEEIATTLSSFIEKNKNKEYATKVEYDEETGLVSDILLTILEK